MQNYIYELLQVPAPADEWTAAWEYLDSLDGPAEAIKEGSYGTNTFLIQKS